MSDVLENISCDIENFIFLFYLLNKAKNRGKQMKNNLLNENILDGLCPDGYKYHTQINLIDRTQVQICKDWILKNLEKSFRPCKYDSYYFKHRVENSTILKPSSEYIYISNGAFILACIELGFIVVPNYQNAKIYAKYTPEVKRTKIRRVYV